MNKYQSHFTGERNELSFLRKVPVYIANKCYEARSFWFQNHALNLNFLIS